MKKLIVGILTFGLMFGSAVWTRAADFSIQLVKHHHGYYNYYDNFSSWDASQRDRISDAYRDGMINRYEFDRLNNELSNVEAYHDRTFSRGWSSDRDRDRLESMKTQVSRDIDREMREHM